MVPLDLSSQSLFAMKRSEPSSTNKLERKTIEKNRRIRMKVLGFQLVSMIPDRHFSQPKEFLSHQDQIDEAASYIKILRERIEGLNIRKAQLMENCGMANNVTENAVGGSKSPILTVKELGFGVEVVLVINGLNKTFILSKVITIIEQEAAQVSTVSIARLGNDVIYTLHAQVKVSRVGVDTTSISGRIHEMISSSC